MNLPLPPHTINKGTRTDVLAHLNRIHKMWPYQIVMFGFLYCTHHRGIWVPKEKNTISLWQSFLMHLKLYQLEGRSVKGNVLQRMVKNWYWVSFYSGIAKVMCYHLLFRPETRWTLNLIHNPLVVQGVGSWFLLVRNLDNCLAAKPKNKQLCSLNTLITQDRREKFTSGSGVNTNPFTSNLGVGFYYIGSSLAQIIQAWQKCLFAFLLCSFTSSKFSSYDFSQSSFLWFLVSTVSWSSAILRASF